MAGSLMGGVGQSQRLVASAVLEGVKIYSHDAKGVERALKTIFRPPADANSASLSKFVLRKLIRPDQLNKEFSTSDAVRQALLKQVFEQGKSIASGDGMAGLGGLFRVATARPNSDDQKVTDVHDAAILIRAIGNNWLNGGQTADAAAVRGAVDKFLQTPSVRSYLLIKL